MHDSGGLASPFSRAALGACLSGAIFERPATDAAGLPACRYDAGQGEPFRHLRVAFVAMKHTVLSALGCDEPASASLAGPRYRLVAIRCAHLGDVIATRARTILLASLDERRVKNHSSASGTGTHRPSIHRRAFCLNTPLRHVGFIRCQVHIRWDRKCSYFSLRQVTADRFGSSG
jgi:hypothetical protein